MPCPPSPSLPVRLRLDQCFSSIAVSRDFSSIGGEGIKCLYLLPRSPPAPHPSHISLDFIGCGLGLRGDFIAKQTDRGYCLLFITNGHLVTVSLGDMMIRGIPADWFIFRRSITCRPTFNFSSWFGIPGNFKLLRNSVGYFCSMLLLFVVALLTVSELWILACFKDNRRQNEPEFREGLISGCRVNNDDVLLQRVVNSAQYCVVHNHNRIAPVNEEAPKLTLHDILDGTGSVRLPHSKFDVLVWESHLPPYHKYIYSCQILEFDCKVTRNKQGQKRESSNY
ncbi:hypothetical protein U9M48_011406 [Paspalum notatum var. saurae]|uniref:Uncharacterized protein n=1 Tax=Paspalum notatum var. saurae TaxID=547442 RepID=A0AAQ3SW64_PASNO